MKTSWVYRSVVVLLLSAVFAYCYLQLKQVQEQRIGFLSFQLNESAESVLVPDADQLKRKIRSAEEILSAPLHPELLQAVNSFLQVDSFSFNQSICREVFMSYDESNFNLVLKDAPSFSEIVDIVAVTFGAELDLKDDVLIINDFALNIEDYGHYKLFSTAACHAKELPDSITIANADFVAFNASHPRGQRHIIGASNHFKITTEENNSIKGRPVSIEDYLIQLPNSFQSISFYGSSRFQEDVVALTTANNEEGLEWVQEGIMIVEKDSFEVLIAREAPDKNFELLMEELLIDEDSSGLLNQFNIGQFKVKKVAGLLSQGLTVDQSTHAFSYYTAYNDYNVLTNSIKAMRWFITEVQLGNLVGGNPEKQKRLREMVPSTLHTLKLRKKDQSFEGQSMICGQSGQCLLTDFSGNALSESGLDEQFNANEIAIEFQPKELKVVEDKTPYLLVYGDQSIGSYAFGGEKNWKLNLSTPMVQEVQLVDFENDGNHEIVIYQENQIDVVNNVGKSLKGFPVRVNGLVGAGLTVNYDQKYVHRIFVSVGSNVLLFNEEGKRVEGWTFTGMNAPIQSEIYHVLTEGKDIIAFKDQSNQQFILNRRGESRLNEAAIFKLKNETDFVVGGMASSLHKMGYENQYIKSYYILDGERDSVKVDRPIAPVKIHWVFNEGNPLMIAEEADRLIIIDQFGYFKSEVLKPQANNEFVALLGNQDYGFVFADNSQNNIYLLNNYGKMMLPKAVSGSSVSTIYKGQLFTFSGTSVKMYKIN